jgi:uncharacterized protein (DUF58 family)
MKVAPTARLALCVLLAAPLWLVPGVGMWLALGGTLLVLVAAAVDYVRLPAGGDPTVERELPATIGIGDRAAGAYHLTSGVARPIVAELTDALPAALRAMDGARKAALPAHGRAELPFEVVGVTRGRADLGRVGVRAMTPLGLVARRYVVTPGDSVLVTPSIASVRRFRLLALQHRLHDAGVRVLRRRGEGRAFAALREYVQGDDPRHIDWKASGKRGKLISREFTIEQSQTVFTLIDAGRSMTQLAGEFSRFEHALSAALVLTDVAATAGDRVGTLVFDDEVRAFVAAQRGRAALRLVREALIPVSATLAEPDYASAFRFLASRQRKRALIVFFTDVMDVRSSRALIGQLTRGASRHLVVVVALRNDELFAATRPGQQRADTLYLAAAAEELVLGREEALERMRRAGATVLDISPQAMTAAVVNRYLEIKSRGAL